MFVLVRTPTSAQPTTETHTFASVYDLLTHVTHLVTKTAPETPEAKAQPPHITKPNISEVLKDFQDKTQIKNELIDEQVFEHEENKEEIRSRINESRKLTQGPVRPQDIKDLHTFFLEHLCHPLSHGKMDLLEITHGWDQFVSFPHKFLTTGEQCVWVPRLMTATKEALVGVPPKPTDKLYSLRRDKFHEYCNLVENVCKFESDAAGFMKPVIQDMCCKIIKAIQCNGVKATDLDPWIQFFVKSRLTKQKGLEVQSSVLFQTFSAWLTERVPSIGFISVQHFSSRMKSIHGFTTHRKASGVFYENVGFTPEKEEDNEEELNTEEPLLHEHIEPPTAWPPSDEEEKVDVAPPFETQWAEALVTPRVEIDMPSEPEELLPNDPNSKWAKVNPIDSQSFYHRSWDLRSKRPNP